MNDHPRSARLQRVAVLPDRNSRGRDPLSKVYATEIAEIKESPGVWFLMLEYADTPTSAYYAARVLARQVPGLETAVRKGAVYVRWTCGQS